MEELKRIHIFTSVVKAHSFSEAARRLNVAKSAVSKQITLLEQEIGVRLFNRTTRKLSLTEAGNIYYQHCHAIVTRAEIALNEVKEYQNQPTGNIKVSAPVAFGKSILLPVIKQLRMLYPKLTVELCLSDQVIDIIEEEIDLTIRVGALKDSNLVATKLCQTQAVIFASPEYLAQCGTPKTPEQLSAHQWISLSILSSPLIGSLRHKKNHLQQKPNLSVSLKVNTVDTVIQAALAGLGISAIAKNIVEDHLANGQLIQLFDDYELNPVELFAVYPHKEHLAPKVRIFLDLLKHHCQQASWAS